MWEKRGTSLTFAYFLYSFGWWLITPCFVIMMIHAFTYKQFTITSTRFHHSFGCGSHTQCLHFNGIFSFSSYSLLFFVCFLSVLLGETVSLQSNMVVEIKLKTLKFRIVHNLVIYFLDRISRNCYDINIQNDVNKVCPTDEGVNT